MMVKKIITKASQSCAQSGKTSSGCSKLVIAIVGYQAGSLLPNVISFKLYLSVCKREREREDEKVKWRLTDSERSADILG